MSGELHGKRIACAHLLDDFSGSAKVLAQALTELEAAGAQVRVTVGSAGAAGFIRAARSVRSIPYRYSESRAALLVWFTIAQLLLFFDVLRSCLVWKADVVYSNTVLTPGAALAGWLCRRTVVVHLHEVGLGSRALFAVVFRVARATATALICVSRYMREALHLPRDRTAVVYNSLSAAEWTAARAIAASRSSGSREPFVVLMACSLKWYKGIDSFLALAARFAADGRISFRLVLNCSEHEWRNWSDSAVPANVAVIFRPARMLEQYADASLVLNLSHREGWIETFGLTLLEAMACGTPVVGPVVGGCTELFSPGQGGWQIDSRQLDEIASLIRELSTDAGRWAQASAAAQRSAERFSPEQFREQLLAQFARLVA